MWKRITQLEKKNAAMTLEDKLLQKERRLYNLVKRNAKREGHGFFLSFKHYKELMYKNCDYCGSPPKNVHRRADQKYYGEILYQGLDRKDNRYQYTLGNVIPSCKDCNRTKSDLYTYEEMKILCSSVQNYRASTGPGKQEPLPQPKIAQRLGAQAQLTQMATILQRKIKGQS